MKKDSNLKEDLELLIIEPKKPRKSKRIKKSEMSADALDDSFVESESKIGIIVGTLVSILALVSIVLFVNYISGDAKTSDNNDKKDEVNSVITNKEEVDNTEDLEQSEVGTYNEEFGSLFLYKTNDNKIISERNVLNDQTNYTYLGIYNCQSSNCNLAKINGSEIFSSEDSTTLINDDGLFIYNYSTDTVLTYKYDIFRIIKALDKEYLIGESDTQTNIYSLKGNKITTEGYEQFGVVIDDKVYSYDDNVISAKKDGKWGLMTIRTNEIILDFNWDALYISNDNLYIAVKDNEYFIINNDGVQLTELGYPMIIEAYSEYFIVLEENKLDIKKYDGESLLAEPIEIFVDYERYKDTSGVKIENKNIVEVLITIKQTDGVDVNYIFNTGTYTIEQK